ncbi:MAG: serine hydrolase [Beijerinckiaceae bacterium]
MIRRILFRASTAFAIFAAAPAAILSAQPALAAPELVVDLSTGQVLHSQEATRPWYPASLTKLMTTYVALDAVRRGRISLQTPLRVSARALRAPPSKMGFKPGTEVTLENALKIIMVKSANDVSITIAEGIGGSVEGFAAQMNATARALGMYDSHFANPNGLHDPNHYSSARDMAILARALYLHFPNQQELYGIGAIRLGRKVLRNHNGLIGRYPGANGMKTGYVCASGFNVVASATRYGRTLIAVVMGSPSATVRTLQAMNLFDRGFNNSMSPSGQLQSLSRSAYASPINMRSEICNGKRRRELIAQYARSMAPAAAPAVRSSAGFHAYANSDDQSAAAFFAADKRGTFRDPGESDEDATPIAGLRLPPRTAFVPIPIYIGRAPGWTGSAAGPAQAKVDPAEEVVPQPDAKPKGRVAAKTIGEPLSLRGARSANKTQARKAKAAKSRAGKHSAARTSARDRKATAARTAKASKRQAAKPAKRSAKRTVKKQRPARKR